MELLNVIARQYYSTKLKTKKVIMEKRSVNYFGELGKKFEILNGFMYVSLNVIVI